MDAHGRIKIRNAQNVIFAANYLDVTSFNGRAYDDSDSLFLKNTYILGNYINNGEVNYYQELDKPDTSIDVTDFLVFNNTFSADDKTKLRIRANSNRDISNNFFSTFSSNKYTDGTIVKSCRFTDITSDVLVNKIPAEKRKYLSMKWIEPK